MPRKAKELSAAEVRRLTHSVSKDGKPYGFYPVSTDGFKTTESFRS